MVKSSRMIVTTVLGLVFGIICMLLSWCMYDVAFWPMGVAFLIHHGVMGVAIGASALRMNWAAHGVFWGVLFGIFTAIGSVGADMMEPWLIWIPVVVWGFLIELLATKAFKQPQEF